MLIVLHFIAQLIIMIMLSDWFPRARLLQLVCQPDPLRLLLLPFSRSFHKVVLQKAERQHQVSDASRTIKKSTDLLQN